MQNDWLLEGRAVDDRGQGTTWEWRDVDGSLPTPDDVAMLEGLMREDFTQVYGPRAHQGGRGLATQLRRRQPLQAAHLAGGPGNRAAHLGADARHR